MSAPARAVTPIGILAERLDQVARRLDALGVDGALVDELFDVRTLAAGLDSYLSACSTQESAALRALATRTRETDWVGDLEQEMLSGHVEGQLLKFLVHATRAQRVLEIGMFTGYSALAMAEALPDHGEVVACEIDDAVAAVARECFAASPAGDRIRVEVAPAHDTLRSLAEAGESFDLVFIDADKPGYTGYLDQVLDGDLLSSHGLVCVDNTLMQGQPYGVGELTSNGRAIAAFNQSVAQDARVEQVLVPLRDGLTLIRRAAA